VEVRTVGFLTGITMQTLLQFEIIWVKLLFLPAMAERASVFQVTPVFIRSNKVFRVPVLAHLHAIVEDRGLPPIVLPIVRVNTYISFVVIFAVRTPHCFEVKNIEVHIGLKFFNQLYRELPLTVRKRAKLPIVAFLVLTIEI
jgi:hypothetical protein